MGSQPNLKSQICAHCSVHRLAISQTFLVLVGLHTLFLFGMHGTVVQLRSPETEIADIMRKLSLNTDAKKWVSAVGFH